MRLICVACGNYVHFEVDVEMVQSTKSTPQGLTVEDSFENGWNDTTATLRLGVIDIVDYCIKQDLDALRWDAEGSCHVSGYITCARCGSKRVCVPYQAWTPPKDHVTLEEELRSNRQEFHRHRKKREYADTLPELR